jgi:2-polyprenyl-3-methyl-5-hydroxy-6-metoxy-1,4-benzoquinol methylase
LRKNPYEEKNYKMKEFWEQRFKKEGAIWSYNPSKSAIYAADFFQNYPIQNLMILGIGYGRNSRPFIEKGYEVSGIEISEEAIKILNNSDLKGKIKKIHIGSILDIEFKNEKYDAVFSFNVLHLFQEKDRIVILNKCKSILNNSGLLFFTVMSELDSDYGKGTEIEYNTFDKKGRPVHYFTERDIKNHFQDFKIIETGLIDEPEEHGDLGKHIHKCRLIVAIKE